MQLIDWFLPLKIKNLLKKFYRSNLEACHNINDEPHELIKKNNCLNNSVEDNSTCYILACGPSINELDLSILKGKDSISVSNFFVHTLYNEISPKFHVFAPRHDPITEKQYISWLKDFDEKSLHSQHVFCYLNDEELIKNNNLFINKEVNFFSIENKLPSEFNEIILSKNLPSYQTVVHIAIYLAIGLGYKQINLLGVDHSWLFHFGKSMHFYNESQNILTESGYNEFQSLDLHHEFKSHVDLWSIYKSIEKYSLNNGIKIYNCTQNSFLDVFEKKQI